MIWGHFPPFRALGFGVIFRHSAILLFHRFAIPPFRLLGSPPLSDGYFLAACSKYIGKIDRMICFFNTSRIVSFLLDHTNYFNRLRVRVRVFHWLFVCQNSCARPQRFFLFKLVNWAHAQERVINTMWGLGNGIRSLARLVDSCKLFLDFRLLSAFYSFWRATNRRNGDLCC